MSVSEPSETLPVRGTAGSSMRLPLHSAGDHNGNAFSISSSSSSSSSSCLGELSPESLRSLSSLSGGRTDSPLDYDMFEVTLMTMVVTKTDKLTDAVWPKEDGGAGDNDDVSVGKIQMAKELSESNDNSVSVYLDANSGEYCQDSWNDNNNLTLALTTNSCHCGNNDDLSSGSGRKHGSSTPDSDATEIPGDDDDEEEALFLSVSSDMAVRRCSVTLISSTSQASTSRMIAGDSAAMTEIQTERPVADDEGPEPVSEGPEPVLQGPELVSEGPEPVSEGPEPVSEGPEPVLQGPEPVSEGQETVLQGHEPVSEGPEPVSEGPEPVSKGPELVSKGPELVSEGPEPVLQGPERVLQGPEPVLQGTEPVLQGTEPVLQGPERVLQGPEPGLRGPEQVLQGPELVLQGHEQVLQGPEPVSEGPERVLQGPEPVLQGPEPVLQGPESVLQGPESVLQGPEVDSPLDPPVDSQTEPAATEDLNENTHSSLSSTNPAQESKEATSPEEAERFAVGSRPPQPNTSPPARAAKTKPPTTKSTNPAAIKPAGLEAKRVSKADLKNIKAKVRSRSTSTPPKTLSQNKSAPANGKKAAPRKEGAQTGDEGKGQRSSADPVKGPVSLKPIRAKSSSLRTNQPEKSSVAVSQTLSASTGSLGCEEAEDGPLEPPSKAVQEVPETHRTAVETVRQSEDAGEEPVEILRGGAGEAGLTEASVEKPRSQSRKVSSKLGPGVRQQGRGIRAVSGPAPPPGSGAGPPGHGSPGLRQTPIEGSMLGDVGQSAGGGSPTKVRQLQSQSFGLPKTRTTTSPFLPTFISRPTANQQPAGVSAGRPAPPTASKLPVKGLFTNLSSSSLGSNENNGAASKASPVPAGAPASTGTRPDERPSRGMCPVGSQSATKPPSSSTNTPSDTAALKLPVMRTRALSLQARTTATGLKAPTASTHKTTAASQAAGRTVSSACQGLTKPTSQFPLQRSGSARLSRLNSAVDKNKSRETPARPTNTSSSSQVAAAAGGSEQTQQQPPPDQVPDLVNGNLPVTSVLPVLVAEVTNTGSSTTGASGLGFKATTGSRSSPKTGSCVQNASRPGPRAVVADRTAKQNQSKEQAEKKNHAILQLRKLLLQGNKRVEALATVIQHLFTEREEALKQKKELSLELTNLRDELVTSSQCCERLRQEKEEVRVSVEEALKRLEEQHKEELVQLEDRLRSFYQTEWDKVHQTYQEEADKCRMLMEQQVEELRSRQEAERKNQEVSHGQKMESLKQQYETSIQELKRIQQTDLQNLEKTLTETETSLSEKISELSAEKEALNEKLQAEEERRKWIQTDKNLKDSHTVYLEQELESLKVVLEIKNNQLHQKEKKLMDMDKLVDTNVKLEECLTKVQQENEDYKARMDKHAALSKQLSNEQAILQQTLQKESKVNKRLSMENEELLWKLHNGDLLASPRRLSPTSPFNSPRNSASFPTTAPLSPR
ncbi:protein piccolo-like [Seriola aureovittata]|uniref:protein piccolo-like n=1 Tax=Seriola aureovittata TaxID=2871759 RepID=UPI0024BD9169|nr:protein piccolo-like [Seriola aureovittata]XP_056228014.1 protein piccolo-like [Seriola aureovittata]